MFGRRSQDDFEDEIRSHLALETERLTAQGMSPEDARNAARKRFGNLGVAEDRFYHGRKLSALDDITRDVRHAFRGLRRTPAFLVTAVVTLSLAIGAVAGMFNVVNTVMLQPLPFHQPEKLVSLRGTAPGSDLPGEFAIGEEFYLHYKEHSKLLAGIFNVEGGRATVRVGDRAERVGLAWPTNDMYSTLGVKPQIGRLPRTEDLDDAVVISDQLWTTWFNRDPAVLGKWIYVVDSLKQVIGVMQPDFRYPAEETMVWISRQQDAAADIQPGNFGIPIVARVKDGVTPEQLSAELKQLASQLPARFGGSPNYAKVIGQFRPVMVPMLDDLVGPTARTSLLILLGAVAVVLLIACANVANLFLVRAETRRRDLTVRRAIGASRAQLMRFQVVEAFVVAAIAGTVAVALAAVTLPIFVRAAPEVPRLADVHMDLATVAMAFALVVVVALACGLVPAIRGSAPDLSGLRAGGRGSIGGRTWGRDMLVVAQTAMALVLLIGSALLLESFNRLRNADAGYDIRDAYTFQFAPENPSLTNGATWGQMHVSMMERLRAIPGVTTVGVVNNLPLDEGTGGIRVFTEGMQADAAGVRLDINYTGGDYFQAMGIRMLKGRNFTNDEARSTNSSTIISKSAAEKLFPGQEALGRRIRPRFRGQDTLHFTVVGIVNDVKQDSWRDAGEAVVYMPLSGPNPTWAMGTPAYVVKSPRAEMLQQEVRAAIRETAPEAPVYREFTMEFLARRSMLELSFTMLTLSVLSVLALVLGAVGLYGTLSYVVTQRTREIGVRMALGATAGAVRGEVVAQGAKVVIIGAVIGIATAFLTTRYLEKMLYEVKAVDPIAFIVTSAVMIGVGILASYMPARRASNVDPMVALRSD